MQARRKKKGAKISTRDWNEARMEATVVPNEANVTLGNGGTGVEFEVRPYILQENRDNLEKNLRSDGDSIRIGTFDEPKVRRTGTGIHAPGSSSKDFELKSSLLDSIKNSKYSGRKDEDPLDHLDMFERLCSMYNSSGSCLDTMKMTLFPLSLSGEAILWEREIPSRLVETWDCVKKEFLNRFFPKQLTAEIRKEICNFRQRPRETFYQADKRMRGYVRSCPHHGFAREALLGLFYKGCNEKFRMFLDLSSGGCFADKTVSEGEAVVDKLARSGHGYDEEPDEVDQAEDQKGREVSDYKKLSDKLDMIFDNHILVPKDVKADEIDDDRCRSPGRSDDEDQSYEEVLNINKSFEFQRQSALGSQHSSIVENRIMEKIWNAMNHRLEEVRIELSNLVYDVRGEMKEMLGEVMLNTSIVQENSTRSTDSTTAHLDERVRQLESKLSKAAEQIHKLDRFLVGEKEETNQVALKTSSREDIKGITLKSGKTLPEVRAPVESENPTAQKSKTQFIHPEAIDIPGEEVEEEKDEDGDSQIKEKEASPPEEDLFQDTAKETYGSNKPRDFRLPFPGRLKKNEVERHRGIFEKILKEIYVSVPFTELLDCNPYYCKVMKDFVTRKRDFKCNQVEVSQDCYAILSNAPMKKLEDPGSFTLPCSIGMFRFDKCLVDLGASVSLMPLSIARKLSLTNFKETKISLILADRSTRYPVGMLEDVPLKIGKFVIPTDFIVLDMQRLSAEPLILGRPFLATAGALIDVKGGGVYASP